LERAAIDFEVPYIAYVKNALYDNLYLYIIYAYFSKTGII
jgi:hypothetical protein